MVDNHTSTKRTIGLLGATGVGVGAIVGGGILALAGVAFSTTGPGALAAFALNGIIAVLTALSFAELSALFIQSGGTYTFAKKVLSVGTAFAAGWVVWFASIVAAVLYALGFASFFCAAITTLYSSFWGQPPFWLTASGMQNVLAITACCLFALNLKRFQAPKLTHHPFYERFDRPLVALHNHYRRVSVAGDFFGNFTEQNI